MKIDRRCFLALVGGSIVGTTLSPVPWKLMDDVAIWTQNWPWTPVPERGPAQTVDTVCPLCPGGCGITVRKIGERAVKIEGRPDYPTNNGSICSLGFSSLQHLYGPDRIRHPMKRDRSSGKWQKITWDEAISILSAKLSDLRSSGMPERLACITGWNRGTIPYLIDRFMTAYGSPNFIRTPSFEDTHELVLYWTQGRQARIGFDLEHADLVINFRGDILDGASYAGRYFKIFSNPGRPRLIHLDHRLSDTAAKADRWIPIKPNTEGAFALGLAHVIIKNGLYNEEFIDLYGFGFEDWQDQAGNVHTGFKNYVLNGFSPEKVAGITKVPARTIENLAIEFARSRHPLAIWIDEAGGSVDTCLAIHCLNALVGSINRPGGLYACKEMDYTSFADMEVDNVASTGRQKPRIDGAGSEIYPEAQHLAERFANAVKDAKGEPPVEILFVAGANPLYTLHDTESVKAALSRIPFVVSFSTVMDETTAVSDLVLPDHHFLEKLCDVPASGGICEPVTGLCRPVIDPVYDTRHIGDTFISLAKRLGEKFKVMASAFPWPDYESLIQDALGDAWDSLDSDGYFIAGNMARLTWDDGFNTASGKFEFYPTARWNPTNKDTDVLPGFREPSSSDKAAKYPFELVPHTIIRVSPGALPSTPFMIKSVDADILGKDALFVEVNPETAKKLGLADGDRARLSTATAQRTVRVRVTNRIMPGIIGIPKGFGRHGMSSYVSGKGINSNELITPIPDPFSGFNIQTCTGASLKKV